ncbi:Transposon Ty3-I Gag-Pol polyprotein [Frankliniella fusca]|uniref:RNA-directed DNA polymerase n=1 Tax=Frankliniella fusca TaxID=407009 RepID=A0AAE1LDU0_9NEOP|nr:Transposon Ty3-I Gag-Pol polyprotein [Frankliniella fusca]
MRKAQLLDPDLMPIIMAVEENKRPDFQEIVGCSPKTRSLWLQFKSLVVYNGLLYRKYEHPSGNIELVKYQLILPSKFIIEHHENSATGNHFAALKTYQSLQKIFYWPGMQEDVNDIISPCEKCAKFKFHKRPKIPLKIFREGVLHGKWHVDICGPINPPSKEGYTYVLVAVEAFSGWPFAIPLKTKSSAEIAQVLVRDVFSVFGSPVAILSDQERCFTSQLMHEICTIYGIQSSNISIAHPAANGKAEKWVRTLKEHIAIMIEKEKKNWPNTL